MSDNKNYWKNFMGDAYDASFLSDNADEQASPVFGGIKFERVEWDPNAPEEPAPEISEETPVPEKPEPETEDEFATRVIWRPNKDEKTEDDAFMTRRVEPSEVPQGDIPEEEEFDDTFDEYDGYEEDEEDELPPIRRNRYKKTGCAGGIMYFLFILCVSILFASVGWLAATDVLAIGKEDKGTVEVTINDGYTLDDVTETLYSNGLIKYKKLFKLYAEFSSAEEKIVSGTYLLRTNFDYRALVNGMGKRASQKIEVEVTVPEGMTLYQMFDLLEEKEVCTAEKLWECAANYDFEYDFLDPKTLGEDKRLEGYLFPDTYKFYKNDKPENVIAKFLKNFDRKWTEEFDAMAAELGYSMHDVIIIASMIEKEAGRDTERPVIASVIYNRLENLSASTAGYLNIDAALFYAIEGTDLQVSTEIDSPYNTYMYKGMPAGPISNPGLASIQAALRPDDTNYYYYGRTTEGTHRFFGDDYNAFVNFLNSSEYYGYED